MLEISKVSKTYGRLQVLNEVNLAIEPGKVTAILGPNGSGKTTLIKTILGLVYPDEGSITFNGKYSPGDPYFNALIGYMPQTGHFPDNLKIPEVIRFVADLRRMKIDTGQFYDYFDLHAHLSKPLSTLSGGTRQKLSAILAFIFDPEIIILDEPTVGLDPVSGIALKKLLIEKSKEGKVIIFTSHIMPTVEEIAEDIVFLLEGQIRFRGSIQEMNMHQQVGSLEQSIANILKKNNTK